MTDHTQLPTLAELRATLTERNRKYDQAMQDVVDGQLELLAATWAALERGEATWPDLYDVAEQMRAGNVGGWTNRWSEVIPLSWQKVQYYATKNVAPPVPAPRRAPARYLAGRWQPCRASSGSVAGECPPHGTYAVYELFGDDGRLLYVGATVDLASRLRSHREKPWVACIAREAADKIDAEGLEAVEILTRRPPLNKQVASWGGPGTLITAVRAASLDTAELDTIATRLTSEANYRWAAEDCEQYLADQCEGVAWSTLCRDDADRAGRLASSMAVRVSSRLDVNRLKQILAEREQATAVAG